LASLKVQRVATVAIGIVSPNTSGKLAEESADHTAAFDIAFAESAGHHAAQVMVLLGEDHGVPSAGGGHGGGNAGGSAANDNNVERKCLI
jgi:hypothetical protein